MRFRVAGQAQTTIRSSEAMLRRRVQGPTAAWKSLGPDQTAGFRGCRGTAIHVMVILVSGISRKEAAQRETVFRRGAGRPQNGLFVFRPWDAAGLSDRFGGGAFRHFTAAGLPIEASRHA
jgi:hypothetical protein